jgi:F0F1-type ATP synthase assembly protein I
VQRNLTTWQALAVAAQFGVTLAVTVGLGVFVGNFVDSRLGLGNIPIFTLVGMVLGLVASIAGFLQVMKKINGRNADVSKD